MKILVLGAHGQVGRESLRALAPLGDVLGAARAGAALDVDLTDAQALRRALDTADADVVVNAAAYTAVDRAETEPALAHRINAAALADIGAWARSRDRLVVHYSTDYVFDGTGTRPYREDDPTAPLGVYGASKLAGETALRESGCAQLVLRTAWVYAAHGKNFLSTMLRVGAERDELRVVDDQRGTPTPASLIADITAAMLRRWATLDATRRRALSGLYHLCAGGECTWYEFARVIFADAKMAGLIGRVPRVVPITTAEYPTPARRPQYSVLDTTRLRETFDIALPHWTAGLRGVIDEFALKDPAC